jgi:hypothetical protein
MVSAQSQYSRAGAGRHTLFGNREVLIHRHIQ